MRVGASRFRRTGWTHRIETIEGEPKKQQCQSDKKRSVRFERSEGADPRTANSDRSNTSGPTQQIDAPIAESIRAMRKPVPIGEVSFGPGISFETERKLRTIVRNQGGILTCRN